MISNVKRSALGLAFSLAESLSRPAGRLPSATPRPDEILILTAYTRNIADYSRISSDNKRAYARKHGYRFQEITGGFDPSRPPAWSKILFVRRALRTHPWVFWTDSDSLIMNSDVRLESFISPDRDIVLTEALTPFRHINTGQMLFRSTVFSRLFLSIAWRLRVFTQDPTWEQAAINYLLGLRRFARIRIVSNKLFNAFAPGIGNDPHTYAPGDFIIHFPGMRDKHSLLARYAAAQSADTAASP